MRESARIAALKGSFSQKPFLEGVLWRIARGRSRYTVIPGSAVSREASGGLPLRSLRSLRFRFMFAAASHSPPYVTLEPDFGFLSLAPTALDASWKPGAAR